MSHFSTNLRQMRLARNLYQRELAEIAGVKLRAYQLYEQGKTEPSIDVLIKFADLFGVTLDQLVGRKPTHCSLGVSAEESQTNLRENPNA